MKQQASNHSPTHGLDSKPLLVISSLALALVLSACGKQDQATSSSAGQQVDSAIAKTEQAAEQAKAKTESTLANAEVALKDAAQKAETATKEAASQVGDKVDDMSITAAVSAGLAKDPDLSAFKINVDTKNGAVTLNGTAPTDAARDKAGSLAKAVKGVNSVDNKLVVNAG
ncbi:BON domain-containing protein [Polaromonas sp. OV174]|nr:BON domain-containing protein [Polaromonas sp. OV174]SFB68193.1 BON domain-containing protein [Polaromonas sp. OV174]